MTYFDYNSENPYYLYTHIHGYRTKVYTPEIGGAPKELKAATDAALKIRLHRPELKDVPLAENPDWPTEQDFIRLEQWFISAQEPPEGFPMDEEEPRQVKKRRGAGERDDHVEKAYKALGNTQAQHLATWINNEYGDEYWKMTADNVTKSKSWESRHPKKK